MWKVLDKANINSKFKIINHKMTWRKKNKNLMSF